MNQKIGILDSGIGGTTILKEIRKILPKEDYIYYADNKNNPYGEKTEEEIYQIVDNIVKFLIDEKKCKMIVLACNTATTCCMNKLKEQYKNIPFVGTVPAIKIACDNNYKNILLLATPATINSKKVHELIKENKKDHQQIIPMPCDGLADAIENQDNKKINEILKKINENTKDKNIDSIILGCTHYPLIKKEINKYFQTATLIDGSLGVAREVKRKLEENNIKNLNATGKVEFIYSKTS